MARPTGRPVREELLVAAAELIQTVGVSGFSYADLSQRIGIKAPSIHHHFRHKEDLVAEVADRYRTDFSARVNALEGATVIDRLTAYGELFAETAAQDMMCLCGAVTAEWMTAGAAPRKQVEAFFADQIIWLSDQVASGSAAGELRTDLDPAVAASTFLATLEGAILLSRAGNSVDPVSTLSGLLISLLAPHPSRQVSADT